MAAPLHSDAWVIGRTITVSGDPFTIAGVMPPEFDFSRARDRDVAFAPSHSRDYRSPSRLSPECSKALRPCRRRAPYSLSRNNWNNKIPTTRRDSSSAYPPGAAPCPRQSQLTLLFIPHSRRRSGAFDRLRRCGQLAAQPRGGAAERDGHPSLAWRRNVAGDPPVSRRSSCAGGARKRRWNSGGARSPPNS